eukprot:TRINITY_DN13820_c0_g1_i1.p1 TRINITY_DN13820_c0_g1~~TRINITY_DN13820_c0_g1_i1.p1  ORF type:complete len:451 (+),score=40.15 TRINITY_DN13820_c0_g1_i1:38-1390(+)
MALAELELYYARAFPADTFYRWLSYGSRDTFRHREFSFTLPGDIYVRYKSFDSGGELRDALVRHKPEKMDLGAVYNHPPKLKESVAVFTPQQRELVFDIDISDYDDVRFCCTGKGICDRCWQLMVAVARTVDSFMRVTFSFHRLLWVFSGRRGLHCWVCDPSARSLPDEVRGAIAHYMSVVEAGADGQVRLAIDYDLRHGSVTTGGGAGGASGGPRVHPSLESVYESVLLPTFRRVYLTDETENPNSIHNKRVADKIQQWFMMWSPDFRPAAASGSSSSSSGPDGRGGGRGANVLAVIKDVLTRTEKDLSANAKWRRIEDACMGRGVAGGRGGGASGTHATPYAGAAKGCVYAFVYPRLDVNVSTHRNHLLKAPFVIHPGTGNVCVPLDFARIERFAPSCCVTLRKVVQELETAPGAPPSLTETLQMFHAFAEGCVADAEAVEEPGKAQP